MLIHTAMFAEQSLRAFFQSVERLPSRSPFCDDAYLDEARHKDAQSHRPISRPIIRAYSTLMSSLPRIPVSASPISSLPANEVGAGPSTSVHMFHIILVCAQSIYVPHCQSGIVFFAGSQDRAIRFMALVASCTV